MLSINFHNYLFIFFVYDVRLNIKKTSLHLKMLLLVINNVKKVINNFYAIEVKFIFDFEKFNIY